MVMITVRMEIWVEPALKKGLVRKAPILLRNLLISSPRKLKSRKKRKADTKSLSVSLIRLFTFMSSFNFSCFSMSLLITRRSSL